MFKRKKKADSENRTSPVLDFSPDNHSEFEVQVSNWRREMADGSKVRDFDASRSRFFSDGALAEMRAARRERNAQKKASATASKSTKSPKKPS